MKNYRLLFFPIATLILIGLYFMGIWQALLLLLFFGFWYASLFAQSFFHHRYAAHNQFTMSKGWETFWYLYSFVVQAMHFLSPWGYGILHRKHHAHADTEDDPHSPRYAPNLITLMFPNTANAYRNILEGKEEDEVYEKFGKNLPRNKFIDWLGHLTIVRIVWGGLFAVIYLSFPLMYNGSWISWTITTIFFIIHCVMGPFQGAWINWFAHKYGYINYFLDNDSKNFILLRRPVKWMTRGLIEMWDVLMLGEAYHNNHHRKQNRSNFAHKKGEFDPIWPVIKQFDKWGIIQLKQDPATMEVAA